MHLRWDGVSVGDEPGRPLGSGGGVFLGRDSRDGRHGKGLVGVGALVAVAILNGEDDAATRYFEARTSDELRTRFRPVANRCRVRTFTCRVAQKVSVMSLSHYMTSPFTRLCLAQAG